MMPNRMSVAYTTYSDTVSIRFGNVPVGEADRDEAENNLNSADFLRFKDKGTRRIKEELMWIANFERRGMNMALQSLSELPGTHGDILEGLGLFMDVTDLYGQIYVLRDIGISLK